MKFRMKLWVKMLLSVLIVAVIVFLASLGYLTSRLEKITLRNAFHYVDATAREHANAIHASLNDEMGMARAMAQGLYFYNTYTKEEAKEITKKALNGISLNNPSYLSVWVSWELSEIEAGWDKPYGRERYAYVRNGSRLEFLQDRKDLTGDDANGLYYKLKSSKTEALADPFWSSNGKVLETSICVPLVKDGRFAGLFGFDVELSRYQREIDKVKPYEGSYAMLISQNGTIVAHTDPRYTGIAIDSIYPAEAKAHSVLEKLYQGTAFSLSGINARTNLAFYATFIPFMAGHSNTPWTLAIIAPEDSIVKEAQSVAANSKFVILIGLAALAVVVWIISYSITRPLARTTKVLEELASGQIDLSKKITTSYNDEIRDIGTSVNTLIDSLYKTTNFAREIGKGNLSTSFSKLSENDMLGEALLEMRKSLEHSKELDNKRKLEEEKEHWANEGVALFAEILRQNADDMGEFAYEVIHNLVKCVGANIGALFLLNTEQEEKFFELAASFAYNRRKYEEKRINYGEGLVGRCAKEGETIFMTELPADYIKIASGLGEENPTCLLIVPLKMNDEIYGVVELASFEVLDDYKIRFVEKIGESIASTILTVKVNARTKTLLEQSQMQAEVMKVQEEEMRQSMMEFQATQEEALRKSAEMESLVNALNSSSFVIEYDLDGRVVRVNQSYLSLNGRSEKDLIGTHHADGMEFTEEQKANYQSFWNDLRNGNIKKETSKATIDGKMYTFIETYSPIFNENKEVVRVLKIAHNITDFIEEKGTRRKG